MSIPIHLLNRDDEKIRRCREFTDVENSPKTVDATVAVGTSDQEDQQCHEADGDKVELNKTYIKTWREKRSSSRDFSEVTLKCQKIQPSPSEQKLTGSPPGSLIFQDSLYPLAAPNSLQSRMVDDSVSPSPAPCPGDKAESDRCRLNNTPAWSNTLGSPIPSSEQNQNVMRINGTQVATFITLDEYNKLKLEHGTMAKEHEQLKLKHNALLEQLKSKTQTTEKEHAQLKQKHNTLLEHLKSKIECPVCYEIPKRSPIPECPNGHIVCQSCQQDVCPMCREPMEDGKSLLAATVMENLLHKCDYALYGCKVICEHADLQEHQEACSYRYHSNGWANLSTNAGINLTGDFVDLGIKFSPVTSFYDFEQMYDVKKKVMWPPNAINFNDTIFFLNVIADVTSAGGTWRFIVELGSDDDLHYRGNYVASIEVFRPGDNSGCRRHFHMHRSTGRLDWNRQHTLILDNSLMQGLFLEKKFGVSVKIGTTMDKVGEMGFCCDAHSDIF